MTKSNPDKGNTATEMFGLVVISDPIKPVTEMSKEEREKVFRAMNIGARTFRANLFMVPALPSGLENSHLKKHANPALLEELTLLGGLALLP